MAGVKLYGWCVSSCGNRFIVTGEILVINIWKAVFFILKALYFVMYGGFQCGV